MPWGVFYAGLTFSGIALAGWMLAQVDWIHTVNSFHGMPTSSLIAAFLASCFVFFGLAAYDVIAVRHLGLSAVTNRRAAIAGAAGYGISNFVGFPWLSGAMVRIVFYRKTGVGVDTLMTVVMASWVAFWATAAAIIGTVLLLQPRVAGPVSMPIARVALGIALLTACAVLMLWLSRGRQIRVGEHTLSLLPRRVTLLQCGAALTDLIGSAAILYVLLPQGAAGDTASFFGLFVVAVGSGVVSHVPAGLGAFEGTMVLGLHAQGQPEVAGALVLYRAFRTVLPFLVANAVIGAVVLTGRNQSKSAR